MQEASAAHLVSGDAEHADLVHHVSDMRDLHVLRFIFKAVFAARSVKAV